ncbi:MAG TPA: metalloregulator ArsR/SmtB family transcription factor [Planctomycetota bacterium]|nr:metalloregulator ArsR/SmtB family transcription factor [Planctomycetota bacterium]
MVDTSPTLGRARARYRGPGDDHPKRSAILDLLKDGEQCAGEIARRLDMTKPTASHHLATLAENGLVQWRQKGCFRFYALVESGSAKPVAEPPRAVKQDPVETPFALAFKRLARARGIEVVERSIGGLAKQQART